MGMQSCQSLLDSHFYSESPEAVLLPTQPRPRSCPSLPAPPFAVSMQPPTGPKRLNHPPFLPPASLAVCSCPLLEDA